jgi:hypothetical protein
VNLTSPRTIGPLCAEVAGLEKVPSLLSLSWLTVFLPTGYTYVHCNQGSPFLTTSCSLGGCGVRIEEARKEAWVFVSSNLLWITVYLREPLHVAVTKDHPRNRIRTVHESPEVGQMDISRTTKVPRYHFRQISGSNRSMYDSYPFPAKAHPLIPSNRMTLFILAFPRSLIKSSNQPAALVPRPRDEPNTLSYNQSNDNSPNRGQSMYHNTKSLT